MFERPRQNTNRLGAGVFTEFADSEKNTENNMNFPVLEFGFSSNSSSRSCWGGNLVRRINHLKQLFIVRLIYWVRRNQLRRFRPHGNLLCEFFRHERRSLGMIQHM